MIFTILIHRDIVRQMLDKIKQDTHQIFCSENSEWKDIKDLHDFYNILQRKWDLSEENKPVCKFEFDYCEMLKLRLQEKEAVCL